MTVEKREMLRREARLGMGTTDTLAALDALDERDALITKLGDALERAGDIFATNEDYDAQREALAAFEQWKAETQ